MCYPIRMTQPFRRSKSNRSNDPGLRTPLNIPPTSLLWPDVPSPEPTSPIHWHGDLGLSDLIAAFDFDKRYAPFARKILTALVTDADIIRWRQHVLADFRRHPGLVNQIESILPRLATMRQGSAMLGGRRRSLLMETSDRLAELDSYTEVVTDLHAALGGAYPLESSALKTLHAHLTTLVNDENFQTLRAELPEMRAPLQRVASLTVGINLDPELRPLSAVLLSINERPFTEPASFLERLIGIRIDPDDDTGIAPLHHVPQEVEMRPFSQFFQDMEKLMRAVAQPVARALGRYARISSMTLAALEPELAFYTAAVRLMDKLEKRGMPFCQPEIVPMAERVTEIRGLVNFNLCLRSETCPVASDAVFDADGRIAILTGPNSGGKTTYVGAVGMAHVLAQAGLFVPALEARISPVAEILTHFPQLETRQQGRLAEEAARLREVFQYVTPHSLVLLNETFSSTSFGEALYLAQDVVCGLRVAGVRAIYATHLVELVEKLAEIDSTVEGDSKPYSLVAGIDLTEETEARPNFRVTRGLPLGRSYAQEIARRYGIGLSQILEGLGKRL